MYFNFLNKINYLFNGVSYQVKNIFRRPIVSTKQVNSIRIDNDNSPDKSALNLYQDPNLFYINSLINNITQKQFWPTTQLEFTESITKNFIGYAFHILETPAQNPQRGDIIVLSSDLGQCENGDIDCYPTYGIIEEWDSELRKLWIKNFSVGSESDSTTENNFFAEDNKFKIFNRNSNGVVSDINGVSVSNEAAFTSDPNYTFVNNTFTMKRVSIYVDSAQQFKFSTNNNDINPFSKNFTDTTRASDNIFNSFVGEYDSANNNEECSLIDAYILEKNGQTGPDGVTYSLDHRFKPSTVLDFLTLENENERYIYAANKAGLPTIIDDIARQLNG